jgi:putative ABC transport system permease protein
LNEELQFHSIHSKLTDLERIKEECRDARSVSLVENLIRDARFGLGSLARNPGFTIIAVVTLALGIGVNSAIFSVVDAVMLRPLPYPAPDRLISMWEKNDRDSDGRSSISPANLADYRQAKTVCSMVSPHGHIRQPTLQSTEQRSVSRA